MQTDRSGNLPSIESALSGLTEAIGDVVLWRVGAGVLGGTNPPCWDSSEPLSEERWRFLSVLLYQCNHIHKRSRRDAPLKILAAGVIPICNAVAP